MWSGFGRQSLLFIFFVSSNLIRFSEQADSSKGDKILKDAVSWLDDHGSKFRCHFILDNRNTGPAFMAMADRRIHDRESIFMIPESMIITPNVIESSALRPSLDMISLVQSYITKETNPIRQAVMQIAQLAAYVLYGIQNRHPKWMPYLKLLMFGKRCNLPWTWSDEELEALQDPGFMKRAKNWKLEVHMLASNIVPKLLETEAFPKGLTVEDLENAMCIIQSKSFNMTVDNDVQVRSIVPGRDLFPHNPSVPSTWWSKGGALRYRYANKEIEHGDAIFNNLNPKGDSTQALFEYGVFESEGSKFISSLPQHVSRAKRELAEKLKVKNQIKYSDRFTFKATALPYFRIESLSDDEVDTLLAEISKREAKLQLVKSTIRSPILYTKSNDYYSCKTEVIALNTLSVHLRDELSGMDSGITQDEALLKKETSFRVAMAIAYRLRFKKLVTHALDMASARAVDTKRKCLSGDEL